MKKLIVLALIGFVVVAGAFAQTTAVHDIAIVVPIVQAIALNSTTSITLNVVAPATPGDAPTGETNNSKYLRYTVVTATSQKVTVQITTGAYPGGITLSVQAVPGSGGSGAGQGTGSTQVIPVSPTAAANLITAIPSCYTGTGATDGAQLIYTMNITPASLVQGGGSTVTVTYTITNT